MNSFHLSCDQLPFERWPTEFLPLCRRKTRRMYWHLWKTRLLKVSSLLWQENEGRWLTQMKEKEIMGPTQTHWYFPEQMVPPLRLTHTNVGITGMKIGLCAVSDLNPKKHSIVLVSLQRIICSAPICFGCFRWENYRRFNAGFCEWLHDMFCQFLMATLQNAQYPAGRCGLCENCVLPCENYKFSKILFSSPNMKGKSKVTNWAQLCMNQPKSCRTN